MTVGRKQTSQRFLGKHPIFGRTRRTRYPAGGVRETDRGVPYKQSPYYWWWYALRLSKRYKMTCEKGGNVRDKNLSILHADFGDLYSHNFERWWRSKGAELFAEPQSLQSVDVIHANELDQYRDLISEGSAALIVIPLSWDKRSILKAVRSQLKRIPVRGRGRLTREQSLSKSKAKYKLQPFKSLSSLSRALELVERWDVSSNKPSLKSLARPNEATTSVSRSIRMGLNIIEGVERGEFPVTRRNRVS